MKTVISILSLFLLMSFSIPKRAEIGTQPINKTLYPLMAIYNNTPITLQYVVVDDGISAYSYTLNLASGHSTTVFITYSVSTTFTFHFASTLSAVDVFIGYAGNSPYANYYFTSTADPAVTFIYEGQYVDLSTL